MSEAMSGVGVKVAPNFLHLVLDPISVMVLT